MTPIWTLTVADLKWRCVPGEDGKPTVQFRRRARWTTWDGMRPNTPRELLEQVVNGKLTRAKLDTLR